MRHFSALLEIVTGASPAAPEAKDEEEEEEFFVDNSPFKSESRGLKFRRFPRTKDEASTLRRFRQEDIPDKATSSTAWKAPEGKPPVPVVRGTGALFEVVLDFVSIRQDPMHDSKPLGCLKAGDVVELFEWDSACIFRRVFFRDGDGWMMIDHPQFGPLLRPKDQPRCATPLVPICVAAAEGNVAHLLDMIAEEDLDVNIQDADGCTPLILAAMREHLDCCVVLLDAGADPTITASGGDAASLASSAMVRALIEGLSGEEDYSLEDFAAATKLLLPEVRLIADRLLDEAEDEVKARRRREQGLDDEGLDQAYTRHSDDDEAEDEIKARRRREQGLDDEGLDQAYTINSDDDECRNSLRASGVLFEVVSDFCVVYSGPVLDSKRLGVRRPGEVVELFEWDSACKFRRVCFGDGDGWMMIDHPRFGLLLRPKDQPPICAAAAEGDVTHLQEFIEEENIDVNIQDADGCTPLILAAMREHLDCCVVLLEAGADPTITASGGDAASLARSALVRALIAGLCGQDYSLEDFAAATERLLPEVRLMADRLLDEVACETEARRRREQGLDDEGLDQAYTIHADDDEAEDEIKARRRKEQGLDDEGLDQAYTIHSDDDEAADAIEAGRGRERGLDGEGHLDQSYTIHSDDDEGMLWEEEQRAACMDEVGTIGSDVVGVDAADSHSVVEDATQGGTRYRVVHNAVRIREKPRITAEIVGTRTRGDIVELHDYDRSSQWRRIRLEPGDALDESAPRVDCGWMLLEHEMLGTLMQKV